MNVARLRKLRGWSQIDLAEAAGTTQPTVSRVEKGEEGVTLKVLRPIAEALEVPLYMLFLDDASEAEIELIQAYRSLPADRRAGWHDMLAVVLGRSETEDQ